MAYRSINVNHPDTTVKTFDGSFLQIADGGAVKIGYGINLDEDNVDNADETALIEYAGAIRFNNNTKKLEYCDGTQWLTFVTEQTNEDIPTVYAMLF